MLMLKLFLLSLVSLSTTDLRVLFFTMDSCPPCRQTEPGIDQLESEGVAVSKIDVRQHQQYARQCQVSQTPTIVIADGNQVVARHTGAMSYSQLRLMVNSVQPQQTPAPSAASQAHQQPRRTVPARNAAVATRSKSNASPPRKNVSPASGDMNVEQRAYAATVRFRVEDSEGVSFATGTIIHRVNNEALVLTCGHVFRDSGGQGKINTDLGFALGQPTTVVGKLMFYDADKHDIALVAIPCPLDIKPMPVAPESLAVQTGDDIFSIGCDRGAPPTVRRSVLKAVTRYSGIAKYDIVGRPVDGRSGGGLFSAGGQLIGVCNAAAVEVDEGIYTGLQSVYWQFAKANLTHLFRRDAVPSKLTFEEPVRVAATNSPATPISAAQASTTRLTHPSRRSLASSDQRSGTQAAADLVVARGDELTPPVAPAVFKGDAVPLNTAIYRGEGIPLRQAGQRALSNGQSASSGKGSMEVIVLVRSRADSGAAPESVTTETITISDPDAQTLEWIGRIRDRHTGRPAGDRMAARLPELQPPADRRNEAQMRAQSPR